MLREKIKPPGGEAPWDHEIKIGAGGSSQNDSNRLPVKFQVNRTSVDHKSKLDIFLTAKSRQALTGPQTASKLKQKPMVGPIYCSRGYMSNFRSFRHRLTQFQLLTENQPPCLRLLQKNRKLCAPICTTSRQVFSRRIKPINEEKCQEKYRRKKRRKSPKNGGETTTERAQKAPGSPGPWSPATLGPWGPGFFRGTHFPPFFALRRFRLPDFPENLIFHAWNQMIFANISDYYQEHVIIISRPTKKAHLLPDHREIDWTDVASTLKLIYVWSCIAIRHQIICGSIGNHGIKNAKRHCAARDLSSARRPINEVKWPFLWQVIAVINSLFWTDQSDSRKSYKSK